MFKYLCKLIIQYLQHKYYPAIMKWIIIIVLGFLIFSCTFKNEDAYFGEIPCDSSLVNTDTIQVNYNDLTYTFLGIFQQCLYTAFSNKPGINMDSYEHVVSSINTGKVFLAINHEV